VKDKEERDRGQFQFNLSIFVIYVTALKIEAVSTSEMLVWFYETTRQNIAKGCQFQTRLSLFFISPIPHCLFV
jgi:hypothetical protein